MIGTDEIIRAAMQLPVEERLKLAKQLHAIELELRWSSLHWFADIKTFPAKGGVYSILLEDRDHLRMVRIGAAHSLRARPANYARSPFEQEARLRVAYCCVPDVFRDQLRTLLAVAYVHRLEQRDPEWAEYRMERLLLDAYSARWDRLPPANFAPGSSREYLRHIDLVEVDPLRVVDLPPADLGVGLAQQLKQ